MFVIGYIRIINYGNVIVRAFNQIKDIDRLLVVSLILLTD